MVVERVIAAFADNPSSGSPRWMARSGQAPSSRFHRKSWRRARNSQQVAGSISAPSAMRANRRTRALPASRRSVSARRGSADKFGSTAVSGSRSGRDRQLRSVHLGRGCSSGTAGSIRPRPGMLDRCSIRPVEINAAALVRRCRPPRRSASISAVLAGLHHLARNQS